MLNSRLHIFLLLLLCSCSNHVALPIDPEDIEPSITHSPEVTRELVETVFPTNTAHSFTTKLAPTEIPPTNLTPTVAITSIPELPMCSPIQGFALEDLPRIISVGYRPPPKGQDDRHEGVDFCFYTWKDLGSIEGKIVQAVLPGRVAAALNGTFPYGSFVIIETPGDSIPQGLRETLEMKVDESLYTLFAHLQDQSLKVELDEEVLQCQALGSVGRTGNTNAPHLHFETRIGLSGARFIGMSNFINSATSEERKNYRIWRISGLYNHFDPMDLLRWGIEFSAQ